MLRTKPRVTVTLDPELLTAIDHYVSEHQGEGVDRSGVVSEALRLWWREQLRQELRAQYLAPRSEEELVEAADWARIRAAAADDLMRTYDEREGRTG
jgi:Arc/MetJ-type ribon-helix-helix transcriptional regulator